MEQIIGFIIKFFGALLAVIDIAMLIRAVTSWLPDLDGAWLDIVYLLTEPVVAPVRAFFERFNLFVNTPIDVSFLVSYLLILVAQTTLGNIDITMI
jgi:uncharacterized protein YggT (Ycf19 family)